MTDIFGSHIRVPQILSKGMIISHASVLNQILISPSTWSYGHIAVMQQYSVDVSMILDNSSEDIPRKSLL